MTGNTNRGGRVFPHRDDASSRWMEKMSDYGEWRVYEQCGGCRYYLRLAGEHPSDWGVCSNPRSDWDGLAMFEHDGCEHFEHAADGWGGPHRSYDYKRDRPDRATGHRHLRSRGPG